MLFQKKVNRAMDYSSEHSQNPDVDIDDRDDTPPLGREIERGDKLAMLISALLVFVPVAIVVVLLMCFIPAIPYLFQ